MTHKYHTLLLLLLPLGNTFSMEKNKPILTRQEKWKISLQQHAAFEYYITDPLINGSFPPAGTTYADQIQKAIDSKQRIIKYLKKREKKYTDALKREFPVLAEEWDFIKKATDTLYTFEKNNRHEPLQNTHEVTVCPEMHALLIKELKKRNIHPSRFVMQKGSCSYCCFPIMPIRKDSDIITVNKTLVQPGIIVVQDILMQFYLASSGKAAALLLIKKLTNPSVLRLSIIGHLLSTTALPTEHTKNKEWQKYLQICNQKAYVLTALKSYKYARAMLQLSFVCSKYKKEYMLLAQIEHYWKMYEWLQRSIKTTTLDQLHAAWHIKNNETLLIAHLEAELRNQSRDKLKQQLHEWRQRVKTHTITMVKALKKKLLVHKESWNIIKRWWTLGQIYTNEIEQYSHADVVHSLPNTILRLLKRYLTKEKINSKSVHLQFSSNNDYTVQEPLLDIDQSITVTAQGATLNTAIKGIKSLGKILVPQSMENKTFEKGSIEDAFLRGCAQTLAQNKSPIINALFNTAVLYNYTPINLESTYEWKRLNNFPDMLLFTALANCQGALFSQAIMNQNPCKYDKQDLQLCAKIVALQKAYEAKK